MYFMFTDTVSTGENQRTKHGSYAPLKPSMKSTDRLKLYRTECARHDIGISWQMYSTRQPVFGAIQQPFSAIHTRLEPTTMPTTQQSIYRCVCRYPLITNERTNERSWHWLWLRVAGSAMIVDVVNACCVAYCANLALLVGDGTIICTDKGKVASTKHKIVVRIWCDWLLACLQPVTAVSSRLKRRLGCNDDLNVQL